MTEDNRITRIPSRGATTDARLKCARCDAVQRERVTVSEPNKHHYIPVFYLKQWAVHASQLCEFSKPYKTVIAQPKHPTATGYQKGLYTMPGVPADQAQSIEKKLMGMTDEWASKAHKVFLAQNPAINLSGDLRMGWARFLYAMTVRNPEKIEQMKAKLLADAPETVDEYRDVYDSIRGPTGPATFEEFRARFLANPRNLSPLNILPMLFRSKRVLSQIYSMNFRTIRLTQSYGHNFLTSDRPVIMTNGLLKPESHMVIPLSPKLLFVADNADAGHRFLSSLAPAKLAQVINDKIAQQSHKYVYGADSSQLVFVSKRLGMKVPSAPGDSA